MVSFSINKFIDLSEVDLTPREGAEHWLGREWLGTIYIQCADGSKGLKPVIPNLDAYAYACEMHTRLKDSRDTVPIITEDELEAGRKGIMLEQIDEHTAINAVSKLDLTFEEEQEYQQQFEQFVDMRELIYLEKSIDFADLVLQAFRQVPTAIEAIRELNKEYAHLDTLLETVLRGADWQSDLNKLVHRPILINA